MCKARPPVSHDVPQVQASGSVGCFFKLCVGVRVSVKVGFL